MIIVHSGAVVEYVCSRKCSSGDGVVVCVCGMGSSIGAMMVCMLFG